MEKLANYRNSVGVLIGASNFSAVNNALSNEIHLDIKVKDWLKKVVERDASLIMIRWGVLSQVMRLTCFLKLYCRVKRKALMIH